MARVEIKTLAQVTPEIRRKVSKYWPDNGMGDGNIAEVSRTYRMALPIARHLLELYELRCRKVAAKLASEGQMDEAIRWSWLPKARIKADLKRMQYGLPLYPVPLERGCIKCGEDLSTGKCKCDPSNLI